MSSFSFDSPLAFVAIQASLHAGRILRKGFGTDCTVSSKTNALNLVTEFDEASEKAIIAFIKGHFPDHAFLAEESGLTDFPGAPVRWIIDPLDGTMNFARQIPLFAISIAALVTDEVEVGVIYDPISDELFAAQRGCGAYLNGDRLRVSSVSDPYQAIGATGFPYDQNEKRQQSIEQFNRFLEIGNPIRIVGSATLNLAYVAAGRFDVYWGANLYPWDVAAGKLLIDEAGGKVTHYDGSKHNMFQQPSTLATNGLLHETILPYLA